MQVEILCIWISNASRNLRHFNFVPKYQEQEQEQEEQEQQSDY